MHQKLVFTFSILKMKNKFILTLFIFFILVRYGISANLCAIKIDGVISPVTSKFIEQTIKKCENKDGLILYLNTPGGLLTSTREIVQSIFTSQIPVITVVSPPGARAGSAGSFIVLASHYAIMFEGTNIGAAHPVSIFGKDIDGDMRKKIENDTIAFMKSIAEKRNRNIEKAISMVKDSKSYTAQEALKFKLIDKVVKNNQELNMYLKNIFNDNIQIEEIEPTQFEKLKFFLSNPDILVLLLFITLLSIYLEIKFGGTFIFAGLGIISFILFLLGLNIIPINLLALLIFLSGILLLILEIFIPSYGLLTISAIILITIGLNMLFKVKGSMGIGVSIYMILTIIGLIGLIAFILGKVIFKDFKRKPETGSEKLIGMTAEVMQWDGKKGKIFINGEYWDIISEDDINVNDKVLVVDVKGLTLVVKKVAA
ncbi:membrane-bound serine protease [Deferribacter desulfuricans SSM1]|uniref:Membrane-bound serine protease n=2 Tax=Deferribacter TaxID=53572 RepID=D3PCF5_DEFDS|nr:membrane-bound serine protease [Deferribacter desulfuricans SSM1]